MINHATFYVVTKPSGQSILGDIFFQSDVAHIATQFKGGLKLEDIVLTTTSESEALFEAHKLLAMQADGIFNVPISVEELLKLNQELSDVGSKIEIR